jgi:hypothetical protein
MSKKRVIILGQGRSGSTLMQRILHCSIDDGFFCGENGGFWSFLHMSIYGDEKNINFPGFKRTEQSEKEEYTKEDNYKPCWYNFYNKERLLQDYRNIFDNMYLSHKSRVFGFKEIRFPNEYKDLQNYINFFKELFPDVFFIFTIRDIETLSKSGWWPSQIKSDSNIKLNLIKDQKNLKMLSENNSNCYLFRFEDYDKIEEIEKVFNFLDEYVNYDKIKMVLSNKYNN